MKMKSATRILILICLVICILITECKCNWDWIHPQIPVSGGIDPTCFYKAANNDPSEIQMERLYKLALKESRTVHVLEGGDEKLQVDWTRIAFEKKFPCLKANLSVNLSKYHEARINSELKGKKKLTFDVATLQTVHDFYIWRDKGVLLKHKPAGYSQIPADIKDPDGYFMAIKMLTFDHYSKKSVENKPRHYNDYLKAEWKGDQKLVLTYPHDDDAVLYQFHQALNVNPNFVKELVKQNPRWVRGTATPYNLINKNVNNCTATFTTAASFHNDQQPGEFILSDSPEIFLTWGQMSAIFKNGKNRNTAKLWLTWWLSKEQQEAWTGFQWSCRNDVKSPLQSGKRWMDFNNTSPKDFIEFMRNRPLVNRLSKMMKTIIGPVVGESPLEDDL